MSEQVRIADLKPREAYLAGFAEAARRIEACALHLRGRPLQDMDGPFARAQKLTADAIAEQARTMQPERV